MRFKIFIFILLLVLIPPSSAEIVWKEICRTNIYTNQFYNCNGYNISSISFSAPIKTVKNHDGNIVLDQNANPSVYFKIKSNNSEDIVILFPNDITYEYKNKIKIEASGFTLPESLAWSYESYNPTVLLIFYFPEKPQINLNLSANKNIFKINSFENINLNLSLKNTGQRIATKIVVKFNSIFGNKEQNIYELNINEEKYISVNYIVPEILGTHIVNAIVSYKYTDDNDPIYINTSYNITIEDITSTNYVNIFLSKTTTNRLYSFEDAVITLSMTNGELYPLENVIITDTNANILMPYKETIWTISSFTASSTKIITYNAVAGKFGNFNLPKAKMEYTIKGIQRNTTSNIFNIDVINITNQPRKIIPIISTSISTSTPIPIITTTQNIITTPIIVSTQTQVIPIIPPTPIIGITPSIPGFEGIFIFILILIIYVNKNKYF